MEAIFVPASLRGHSIKNRIVMAPMVCFGYAGADGKVTEKNLKHYEARAKGGAGTIIVEATCVAKAGRLAPVQLGLWEDGQIEGFSELARRCHRYGATVLVQIHHAGLAGHRSVASEFITSSDWRGALRGVPEATARGASPDEIKEIIKQFTAAALRAQKAGLDGVELHGAHGYLLSQFFSPVINQRKDSYGGPAANRARLAAEIIASIRHSAGEKFIIGCRMGCNEPGLPEGIEIAHQLEVAGIDVLHVSTGMSTVFQPANMSPSAFAPDWKYSWLVYGASEIKKRVKVPVICVGGIRTAEQANGILKEGLCDFTALGKGLLVDPEWVNKAQSGSEVVTCLDCKMCAYFKPGAEAGADCPRRKEKVGSQD